MKTNVIKTILVIAIAVSITPVFAFARPDVVTEGQNSGGADQSIASENQSSGGADVSISATGQNSGGADTNVVITATGQNSGGADQVESITATGQSSGGADTNIILTATGQNSGGADVVTPTPTTPPTPPSSSSGGSSSWSGGGSSSYVNVCNLISSSMKRGWNNDSNEVSKLQIFLKNVEKMNVDVTGIFDLKTEDAVKAFQLKYADVILRPWGSSVPSGFVYITTVKKINLIACNQPMVLSIGELNIINAFRNRGTTQAVGIGYSNPVIEVVTPSVTPEIVITSVEPVSQDDTEVTSNDETNTAAAGNVSLGKRFWNFIVSLFK